MPQRDLYHEAVRNALIHDSWQITSDPYYLTYGGERGYVDLSAAETLAATQRDRTIAVEIKSFLGPSPIADLERAVGHYLLYASWMRRVDPARERWLAVSDDTYQDIFTGLAAQAVVEDDAIRLLVVQMEAARIVLWKP